MAPSATSAAHFGFRIAMGSRVEPPPIWRGSQAKSSSSSLRRAATSEAWEEALPPQLPRLSAAAARTAGFLSFSSSLILPAELKVSSGNLARMPMASARVCESPSLRHLATMSPTTGLQASSPKAARAVMAENRVPSLLSFAAMSLARLSPPPKLLRARQAAPCTSGDLSAIRLVTVASWSLAPIMPSAWMATTFTCSSAEEVSEMSFASLSPYFRPSSPKAPMAPTAAARTFALPWARGR
mmetsp:Transcript_160491/g.389832  ORF Transcript_160491/g.389832 Transcript_160491/m.389832 type:complete len:241 (-) Transcript_160491:279-1001(-)